MLVMASGRNAFHSDYFAIIIGIFVSWLQWM